MAKRKRKLTAKEKAAKKLRRKEYMMIFIRGKQKRVRRPPTIDGLDVDEFIRINADPVWLQQNGCGNTWMCRNSREVMIRI